MLLAPPVSLPLDAIGGVVNTLSAHRVPKASSSGVGEPSRSSSVCDVSVKVNVKVKVNEND